MAIELGPQLHLVWVVTLLGVVRVIVGSVCLYCALDGRAAFGKDHDFGGRADVLKV